MRVGDLCGEAISEGGDYFGMPVVIAKRLCDRCDGGQVLVFGVVRDAAVGAGVVHFDDMGSLSLKGLSDPVPAAALDWTAVPIDALESSDGSALTAAPTTRLPLPTPLTTLAGRALVGRRSAATRLRRELEAAQRGGRRLVLLAGEPGIGKTRLATELATQAHADGAVVLYGRCDEGALIPFQPFVEALGALGRAGVRCRVAAPARRGSCRPQPVAAGATDPVPLVAGSGGQRRRDGALPPVDNRDAHRRHRAAQPGHPAPRRSALGRPGHAADPQTPHAVRNSVRAIGQLDSRGAVADVGGIVRAIGRSRVPVVAWVGPSGAEAAGGAALVVEAAHVAFVSQGSSLGPAKPVRLDDPGASRVGDVRARLEQLAEERGRDANGAGGLAARRARPA